MISEHDQNRTDEKEEAAEIFLCHNRLDAETVMQIADALEIETGTLFFLDRFAIPTGVEFLEYIDAAMTKARGCAIFLGANGWGPTQFWEAELALSRYRHDPDFRLIPIALPGLHETDMRRLGDGSVFNDINRSDLSREPPGEDELKQLAAAISGTAAPQFRTPARLTPYQLRRDAGRWKTAKSPRAARDILYQGAELKEAEAIIAANPDFVVLSEVQPFIAAADRQQRDRLRRFLATTSIVSVVLCALTIAAILYARIAETRQQESLSRALAIQATQEESPRRRLLVALEAFRRSETPEAQGAILSMLEEWQPLVEVQSVFSGIWTAVADREGNAILVGQDTGEVYKIAPGASPERLAGLGSSITALAALEDAFLAGTLDGFLAAVGPDGNTDVLVEGNGRQAYITAIAAAADGSLIAAGDHEGRVYLLKKSEEPELIDLTGSLGIDNLAFAEDGTKLAVTTGDHQLVLFDTMTLEEVLSWPLRNTTLDLEFLDSGRLAWVTSTGLLQVATLDGDDISVESSHQFDALYSFAKIDSQSGIVALGESGGFTRLADLYGFPVAFDRIQTNGDPLTGIGIVAETETLFTTDTRGNIAIWSLGSEPRFGMVLPNLPMEPDTLLALKDGSLLGVSRSRREAAVWRLNEDTWLPVLDLVAETRSALGDAAATLPENVADADGFIDLSATAIGQIALSENSIAWSTWNGGLLVRGLDDRGPAQVMRVPDGEAYQALAMTFQGDLLAAARYGLGEIEIFGTNSGSTATVSLPSPIEALDFSRYGSHIAAGLSYGKIAMASVQNGTFDLLAAEHATPVAGVDFLSGKNVLSYGTGGGLDRELLVHNSASNQQTRRIRSRQPGGSATAAAFSEKLDLLAVADLNGELHLWRASDQRYIRSLFFAGTYLPAVAIDDEAQRLIATDGNGAVRAWPLDPSVWTGAICAKVDGPLTLLEWQDLMPGEPYAPACEDG